MSSAISNKKLRKRKEKQSRPSSKELREAFLDGKRKAQKLVHLISPDEFYQHCAFLRKKANRTKSLLDKKYYDGTRSVAKGLGLEGLEQVDRKGVDILMLCQNDWANTGYRFSKCLELLGFNVVFLKGAKHPYDYPAQAPVDKALSCKPKAAFPWVIAPDPLESSHIRLLAKKAKVIHFIASTYVDLGVKYRKKNVVVQHGGTTYRTRPARANKIFNKISNAAIIQCPDLLGLGAKNEHLIYYPVQTGLLSPNYERGSSKVLVGHFPSSTKNKGTSAILSVIEDLERDPDLRDRFEYVGIRNSGNLSRVSWEDQLKRVSDCDILIETLNVKQNDKKYGEWGNTAIEAAALGTIVVTNSLSKDVYKNEYGDCALNIANTKDELRGNLERLLGLTDEELLREKVKTREWVVESHSMEACAKRLWERVYCKFFPEKEEEIRSMF